MVVLSTASPFKFPRSVLEALGKPPRKTILKPCRRWKKLPSIPLPQVLPLLRQKAERFSTVIDPAQIAEVALGYQA